jgi:hypothetical protein
MDADDETLRYVSVAAGVPELVDNGIRPGGAKHRVGESTAIAVDAGGVVRIAHMDATDGRLLMALRGAGGVWSKPKDITPAIPVPQPDATLFYGFFTSQALVGQDSYVLSFYVEQGAVGTVEDARLLVCSVAGADAVSCR